MVMKPIGDVAAGRLTVDELASNFTDVAPPLDAHTAVVAANRCHYCYDAPCVSACPTGIDIPGFIRKISNGNLKGAAQDILVANPLGGMCARVCPTEILCEGACVRHHQDGEPVAIGALQRHATDAQLAREAAGAKPMFTRAPSTQRHVAVVGAGPAGLACAHRLALAGHQVTLFDAHNKAGGLNEYGIAAYKSVEEFAQREINWLLSVGGIEWRATHRLGFELSLAALREQFDAVFLGIGLADVNALRVDGNTLEGVIDAVAFIARLRQTDDLSTLPVGRRVVVIGGGNTAIDAAVQSRKLGARDVTIVYRRGAQHMSATTAEQAFAKQNGVKIIEWARPLRVIGEAGRVAAVEFEVTQLDDDGKAVGAGETFRIEADVAMRAIGQTLGPDGVDAVQLTPAGARIAIDAQGATSLPGVWAGGDCTNHDGPDLTVQAVQDGKIAATAIDRYLAQTAVKAA
jgi:dihydropyrimidine dehydrogenase (NAD+) subunit PreT